MTLKLRSGIIGTGFMGSVHAHAVRAAGGEVSAIAGSSQASAEAAAAALGARTAAESPEALIARDDVDVIHICTPNATHADLARKAIAAGKAVVCEKPLATSVGDARELTDLADRAGVVTGVPFVYRFYPAVREARDRILRGDAGRLWLLHGSYLQDWLAGAEATNWRVDSKLGGASRAFGDIGVHWCDLMEFTTGHRITRLVAKISRAYAQRETGGQLSSVATEDGATLLFETDKGATGSLVVSQVSPGRKNRLWFSFDGTDASFSFNQERPDTLHIGRTDASSDIPVGPQTLGTPGGRRYAKLPPGHPQGYQDSFNSFVADVYAAVQGQAPEGLPTFRDGLRAALLTDALVTSAAQQSWVDVPGTATPFELLESSPASERQKL
ncbi:MULTISPECIES: Gfo/Idh/MocA family protein [Paenarthrobacter]|uniref:Gfo/Idh/MocA family oxidoreductase n=1 Tax=Paenarthrobacter ureafaciens TaxID=37931 RepID=A0AAX3EHX9_PAEUR|nr:MULTISPECIES: Gfo/Idh/MocA family oxidoreductase [Paenarthrobacter]NKR11941.1 oxidoreductase [Arthrobacter sp. M5]NKR16219.1 oxidoreductase [Arthrobacter sp. M6]OEH57456.1 oxidoreductase [Arthrobacter sp. D4]OEH58731.1 oxidoreductase [Arthrobacter sp. D2]MDO5866778.1 Gfo/Idh/MocA family oxidoreductase [Paenarthrobacter sp. SD-2]